jgi:hypothetical protein
MDWVTISSLATAGGTLVLAVATFSSVQAAKASAQLTERSLLAGLRPVLTTNRDDDREERIMFGGGHWVTVPPHRAVAEVADGVVYLALGLRNVGSGLAVIHGWHVQRGASLSEANSKVPLPEVSDFRRQLRDLYVPSGDTGFWQGALRDPEDPDRATIAMAAGDRDPITIHLLYGDHEGGQRTVTRFSLVWDDGDQPIANVTRYWNLDREDPR